MLCALGTVVASELAGPFETMCTVLPPTQVFEISKPGYALQVQVGEGGDLRILMEPIDAVFRQVVQKMELVEAGKRGICFVKSVDQDPHLGVDVLHSGRIHFQVMNRICRRYGLEHMPFEVDNNPDDVRHILRSAADFYWNLSRSNRTNPFNTSRITVECVRLKETGQYTDFLEEVLMPDPDCIDLNRDGEVVINIDENEDTKYGFKITNRTDVPLYSSIFYFDISDLSIGM